MLNKSTGNMYPWLNFTWNTVKGECPHDCSYCYMKRWGQQAETHFDEREFKTDLGSGNFIFVGSSNDLFAGAHPGSWQVKTLEYCNQFPKNRYLFQSKNPLRMLRFSEHFPVSSVVCTTIETNRDYPDIRRHAPRVQERAEYFWRLEFPRYVTVEPILDFDLDPFICLLLQCAPAQVNIGADSGNHGLPEPRAGKVRELITQLEKFTTVELKRNLNRILKEELNNDKQN